MKKINLFLILLLLQSIKIFAQDCGTQSECRQNCPNSEDCIQQPGTDFWCCDISSKRINKRVILDKELELKKR